MDFSILSVLYVLGAVWTLWQLIRGWRGFLAEHPSRHTRNLASLTAFLLLTPPAVYLHELGHALAIVLAGARFEGIGFFLYYGYTSYSGRVGPVETWIIASAGPVVTLVLGWAGIALGLTWRTKPAINLMLVFFGLFQLLQILLFYPLLTAANLGGLQGSDFAVLYDFSTVPALAVLTGIVQIGSIAALFLGSRNARLVRRYAEMTDHGSQGGLAPAEIDPASPSIAGHLKRHENLAGPGLLPGGNSLPDDETEIESAMALPEAGPSVDAMLGAIIALVANPSAEARQRTDDVLGLDPDGRVLKPLMEALIAALPGRQSPAKPPMDSPENLYLEMRALLLSTRRVGTAKVALGILGMFRMPHDEPVFELFARHRAFTRIAATSLANSSGNLEHACLRLLPLVDGLAKVEVIELLLRDPSPAAQRLLMVQGLVPGYEGFTALGIARCCRIAEVLGESPDPAVIDGIGAILAVLAHDAVYGGPGGTMTDYPSAALALERYLDLMQGPPLPILSRLAAFHAFLQVESPILDTLRRRLLATVEEKLASPAWPAVVQTALGDAGHDPAIRPAALTAARALHIPVKEHVFRWLANSPPDQLPMLLGELGREITAADAPAYAEAALRAIAPTPGDHPADGVWERTHALTAALDALAPFPDAAQPVVVTALHSSSAAQRTKALAVAGGWRTLPGDIARLLPDIAQNDPEPSVRMRAQDLVRLAAESPPETPA